MKRILCAPFSIKENGTEQGFLMAKPLDPETLFRPVAASMRSDPRFMPLMAKVGLLDFWRKTGKWPDFCQAADRPYDCRAVAAKLAP